jgi:hypothetical protein
MIGVNTLRSRKLADLPSDRARVAWLDLLLEAKIQRPEGTFGSLNHLRLSAKHRRDCIPALLDAGLLHAAPAMCSKCRERFGDVGPNAIVVHDWHDYQEPSRWTQWRAGKGKPDDGPSAPGSATPDAPPLAPSDAPNVHPLRARAGASASVSESTSEPDGVLAVLSWLAGRRVSVSEASRTHIDLARLVDQHGPAAVIAAMGSLEGDLRDGPQFVYGARKALNPIPDVRPGHRGGKGFGPTQEAAEAAFGGKG